MTECEDREETNRKSKDGIMDDRMRSKKKRDHGKEERVFRKDTEN